MANIACDSAVRNSASLRRCIWSALRRPIAVATSRKSSRSSHSSGAEMENVYSGSTKKKSYIRNEPTAVPTASQLP